MSSIDCNSISANAYLTVLQSPEIPYTDENRTRVALKSGNDEQIQKVIDATKQRLENLSPQFESLERKTRIAKKLLPVAMISGIVIYLGVGLGVGLALFLVTVLPFALGLSGGFIIISLSVPISKKLYEKSISRHQELVDANKEFLENILGNSRHWNLYGSEKVERDLSLIRSRIQVLKAMQNPLFFSFICTSSTLAEFQCYSHWNQDSLRAKFWEILEKLQKEFEQQKGFSARAASLATSVMATAELTTNGGITKDISERTLNPILEDCLLSAVG